MKGQAKSGDLIVTEGHVWCETYVPDNVKFRLTTECFLTSDIDDDSYVLGKIDGQIIGLSAKGLAHEDDDLKEIEIGRFDAWDLHLYEMGASGYEIMDEVSADHGALANALWTPDGTDFQPWVNDLEVYPREVLFIERMVIDKPWRGYDIGVHLLWWLMRHFHEKCAVAICQPQPIRFEKDPPQSEREIEAGRMKLARYYERVGFKRMVPTDFYVADLSLRLPWPGARPLNHPYIQESEYLEPGG